MDKYVVASSVLMGVLGLIWNSERWHNVLIKSALIFMTAWGFLICAKQF